MVTKEEAKKEIQWLVEKYKKIHSDGSWKRYNEAQTRNDFILPFFEALGWDIRNRVAEEVILEESASNGRVDFAFKIGGITKFFLETKPLRKNIDDVEPAEQAINYAWHKSVTWAVLTNFEKIKIFNCEWKEGNILRNQFIGFDYEQFIDKFEFLWLLSKESMEKGELDRKAEDVGKKIIKIKVSDLILDDLIEWRKMLSSSISKQKQNKDLSEYDMDEAVQRLIDRLIFIRVCEDRQFENMRLRPLLSDWDEKPKKCIEALHVIFKEFNATYDSKLFDRHLCDDIIIESNVLKRVIKGLYQTKDGSVHYDFAAIDSDVLGMVYEQYLGYLLKKRPSGAGLKENHAHRKEQGIYYTPTHIVNYIVENTVGELLKERKPSEIKNIKILDPACGSGSFLLKAYDVLERYWKKQERSEFLFGKKTNIMLNNIYGVDLDPKAVEIAQLNLLLKMAEKKQKLPMLQQNIKCGNSLIDDPKIAGDKAFKWEEEFKKIMQEGGFDVVIGNPPYVDIKQLDPKIVRGFFDNYSTVENRMNLYAVFVERSLNLLKDCGYFGFIIPNSILYNESYQKIRAMLLDKVTLRKVVRLPDNTFQNVKVETIILIYQKRKETTKKPNCEVIIYPRDTAINSINKENNVQVVDFNQKIWETENNVINISTNTFLIKLLTKMEKETKRLIDICDFSLGLTPYDKYKGHTKSQIEERVFHSKNKKNATFKPLLSGENIIRYGVFWNGEEYISYGSWLGAHREQRFFTKPRIIVRQIISGKPPRIYAGYTEEEFYNAQIAFNILAKDENRISLKYLLAVLNSKLMNFYHKEKFLDPSKNLFQKILIVNAKKLPIKILLEKQQSIIKLVDKMLSLNKHLNEIGDKKTDERARIEEEIRKTDDKIDELVYNIYGITEEEKKIIEENIK